MLAELKARAAAAENIGPQIKRSSKMPTVETIKIKFY